MAGDIDKLRMLRKKLGSGPLEEYDLRQALITLTEEAIEARQFLDKNVDPDGNMRPLDGGDA